MPGRLAGQVAIITGAGSGIGRATALLFAAEGARVMCADIHSANVQETARMIGDAALAASVDVAQAQDVENAATGLARGGGWIADQRPEESRDREGEDG